jgi:uncharacterized protein
MPGAGKCPLCQRPTDVRWRPFCSKRCADVDLNRWLSGRYAVPVVEEDGEDGEDGPPAGGRMPDDNGPH